MKKLAVAWISIFLVLVLFLGIFVPVSSDTRPAVTDSVEASARGARWSSYKAYYNQTFTIEKGWQADNVSVAVFLQTDDQTSKNKDSQGSTSTPTFNSAEVMQSTIDFLDGSKTSTGTTRHVLGELFTATWCQYCPGGVGAFDRMTRDPSYFPVKTTLIELHGSGDHGNADGAARGTLYNFGGIPTAIFDGYECFTGGNADPNSTTPESHYKRIINNRVTKQSIVDITTFGQKTSSSGWINASVELLSPTPIRNLKVQFFLLEDIYPANNTGAFYRHTVQKILTPLDFIPTNHKPTIQSSLQSVTLDEDGSDATSIQLKPAFDDEDLDVLSFESSHDVGSERNITVEIDDDGNVTMTPKTNWNGVEEITFYAFDGKAYSDENKVTITVNPLNDAPMVANPMSDFTMFEDIPVEDKFNLSSVFYDFDLDPEFNQNIQDQLIYTYSGDENIKVTIDDDTWVSFDPDPNWNGNETIIFSATDSQNEKVMDNVRIWVRSGNDRPKVNKTFSEVTLNEDERLKDFLDLNDYFTDPDGDSLTFDYEKPENFDVKLKYSLVTLIPDPNFWGTEVITFSATDIPSLDPIISNMTATVASVNDQPILNYTDAWVYSSANVKVAGNILEVEQDAEVSIFVTAYDPADYDKLVFSDDTELFDIDEDTGEIAFTPTNDHVGYYQVNISVDDQQSTNNLAWEMFTFNVENVNDPPEIPVIISPVDTETYVTDTEIDFEGTCDDPDLLIDDSDERLNFEWSTNKSSDVLSVDKEFKTKLAPGVYEITLKVTDRAKESSSAVVVITVDINRIKDSDSDGIPDYQDDDDDGDGMLDSWELKFSLDPMDPSDATEDSDRDGFTNLQEYLGDDGKVGGDDSSNPKQGSSVPDLKDDSGDGETSSYGSLFLIEIIMVIIIVVVLVILFMVMRSRKKQKEEETPQQPELVAMPPTTPLPIPQGQFPAGQEYPQYPIPTPEQMAQWQMQMLQMQDMQQMQQGQTPSYQDMQYPMYPHPGQQMPPGPTTTSEAGGLPQSPMPTEAGEGQLPVPKEEGLPPSLDERKLLPGVGADQATAQPEVTTEPPSAEATTDTNMVSETGTGKCPHCGEAVKDGWMLCPNCKEMM